LTNLTGGAKGQIRLNQRKEKKRKEKKRKEKKRKKTRKEEWLTDMNDNWYDCTAWKYQWKEKKSKDNKGKESEGNKVKPNALKASKGKIKNWNEKNRKEKDKKSNNKEKELTMYIERLINTSHYTRAVITHGVIKEL
jgi:membrane-bound lytic murein transglycosylase